MLEFSQKKENCCGCSACVSACPIHCISMVLDEEGFLYPSSDDRCIHCGKCVKLCPRNNSLTRPESCIIKAYGANHNNDKIRYKSSSGGVFYELCAYVLSNHGTVCAPRFDSDQKVHHVIIDKAVDIESIIGSKYVQSSLSKEIYKSIKTRLINGELVMFSGTPCQCKALRCYLEKDYDNLIIQDVICHGVIPYCYWNSYISKISKGNPRGITKINFRDKKAGWNNYALNIEFLGRHSYRKRATDDPMMKLYNANYLLKNCCYLCGCKSEGFYSDITLGDLWGISTIAPELSDNKGTTCVLTHTPKGDYLFDRIKSSFFLSNIEYSKVLDHNPAITNSSKRPTNYDVFRSEIERETFKWRKIANKYAKRKNHFVRALFSLKKKL